MRLAWFAFVLAGCGAADFDISEPVPAQTIHSSPLGGVLGAIFQVPLSLDISAQIKAMDTGPIKSVTLKSLELTITSPSDGDWSFVSEIDVFVSSTKQGSTLPKTEIAHVSSPGKVKTMSFAIVPGVDLNPYITEGSQVDGQSTGTAPTSDTSYDGTGVFTVHPL